MHGKLVILSCSRCTMYNHNKEAATLNFNSSTHGWTVFLLHIGFVLVFSSRLSAVD